VIAAERKQRIYEMVLARGAVTVLELSRAFGAVENTIRKDLDALDAEGKVVRTHGGAIAPERGVPSPPYSQIRSANLLEKSRIGQAALAYLPKTGLVHVNAGSTAFEFITRIPQDWDIQITTNSPDIAAYLAANTRIEASMFGGRMVQESMETDGSFSLEVIERLYWDACFVGINALDPEKGITEVDLSVATMCRKVIERSRQVIGLCDSSKFRRYSRASVGPVSLIDVLITDPGIDDSLAEWLSGEGVEVVRAGGEI
jgi:DeoR/GlpR family transcriptional regulator of sugar metabolism